MKKHFRSERYARTFGLRDRRVPVVLVLTGGAEGKGGRAMWGGGKAASTYKINVEKNRRTQKGSGGILIRGR